MDNINPIFTRMRLGLDVRVWLTMLIVFIISLLLLSFKMATSVHCIDYTITSKAITADKTNSYYRGDSILFSASVPSGGSLVWDFNDGTKPVSGNNIRHPFIHNGNYIVTTTYNNTCIQSLKINIQEFISKTPIISPSNNDVANIINGTDTPHVGDKVIFSSARSADTYNWSVLNSPNYLTQTDSIASWKFAVAGPQTIVLKINGDDKIVYRKQIIVLQALQVTSTTTQPRQLPPPVPIPPKIISFNPISGGSGTSVTIKGLNFTNVTAVAFGGTPAASFALVSPTAIIATVGGGASGNVSVTTRNGVGMSMTTMFTYAAPAVISNQTVIQPPAKIKILLIPDEEFKHMFQQVCDGKSDASAFNAYLCNGEATKVSVDKSWTTVGELCKKLKDKKKILIGIGHKEYKINSVQVTRDVSNNNCVTLLTVDYK